LRGSRDESAIVNIVNRYICLEKRNIAMDLEEKAKEYVQRLRSRIEPAFHIRDYASFGPIIAVWYGNSKPPEECLTVVNHVTGKEIYTDLPPMGMDADYDVERVAREVAQGVFYAMGNRCAGRPPGLLGPDGWLGPDRRKSERRGPDRRSEERRVSDRRCEAR
jgi:hypothetical protein